MGLTTFVGNQPTLKESVVAKNYLNTLKMLEQKTSKGKIYDLVGQH